MFVVIVIALVMSLFTFTGKPSLGRRLTVGGQMMAEKLRETRQVAAMRRCSARLLIHTDDRQPEYRLRGLAIVVEHEPGDGKWELVGEASLLPENVYWVPAEGNALGWTGPISEGGTLATLPFVLRPWIDNATCWFYEFKPTGRITNGRYDACLGTGFIANDGGVVFQNPQNSRALRVNAYGLVSEIATSALPP